jgi:DNA-binding transcriptional LysR family regulator
VRLSESIPRLLIQDIRESHTDVAIMYPPSNLEGLETRTVFREPLVVALAARHPLDSAAALSPWRN